MNPLNTKKEVAIYENQPLVEINENAESDILYSSVKLDVPYREIDFKFGMSIKIIKGYKK